MAKVVLIGFLRLEDTSEVYGTRLLGASQEHATKWGADLMHLWCRRAPAF